MADQVIKIFCPAQPYQKQFSKSAFKTIAQFQRQLQDWFGIPSNHQILIKDSMRIDLPNTNPFDLLNLNSQSRLMVVASSPPFQEQEELRITRALSSIKQNRRNCIERERQRQAQMVEVQKLLSCQQIVHKIVHQFIRSINLPRPQLLLLDPNKLNFILHKISRTNPRLQTVLLKSIPTVMLALIDKRRLDPNRVIKQTIVTQQVDELLKLNYRKQQIVVALQISKNNIQEAIDILYHRRLKELRKEYSESKGQCLVEEYLSIHHWLQKQGKNQLTMLTHVPEYIDIYLNSLKHVSPSLFNVFL